MAANAFLTAVGAYLAGAGLIPAPATIGPRKFAPSLMSDMG